MSNAPTILLGLVPLIRAVVRSGTTATATTVTPDDSGTIFVNLSTSAHTYTLPAVANGKGKAWIFFNADGTAAIAVSSTAANLKVSDTDSTTNTEVNHEVGGCMLVIGDGTWYYGLEIYGTWTAS